MLLFSIHTVLSLLYLGATPNSTTEQELQTALGRFVSQDQLENRYRDMQNSYLNQDSFSSSNTLWLQNQFKINTSFKEHIQNIFKADTKNIDFSLPTAVDTVNRWISKKTGGLIPKLVQAFSSSTSMFIANALYFKDKWLTPFQEKNETGVLLNKEPFYYGGRRLEVPMMLTTNVNIQTGNINLGALNATFVNIPYINRQFEMQLIFSNQENGFAILEDQMKEKNNRDNQDENIFYPSIKKAFEDVEDVRLIMPKFSVSSKFDVAKSLKSKSFGLKQIFRGK